MKQKCCKQIITNNFLYSWYSGIYNREQNKFYKHARGTDFSITYDSAGRALHLILVSAQLMAIFSN